MSGAVRRPACHDAGAVDYGQLDRLLGYAIARVNLVSDATFRAAVGDRAITPLRYSILEIAGCNPGLQQVQLADALMLSRSAVTLLLDYWQARGCIERRPTPVDRRSFGIFLTVAGASRLADLRERTRVHDRELSTLLSSAERVELRRLLEKLGSGRC
jgi:DNA-binding MarR family transcriptional regulator